MIYVLMYGRIETAVITKIAKSDLCLCELGRINPKMVFEKPAEGAGISKAYFFRDFLYTEV